MGASTNGSPVGDYRARLDGFKRADAERVALVDVQYASLLCFVRSSMLIIPDV